MQQKNQKVEMSPEDKAALAKIRRDWAYVRGWAGGDDHPFRDAEGYDGYTVTDARNHMSRLKQQIEEKYGIVRIPSEAARRRQEEKAKEIAKKRKDVDLQVLNEFPYLRVAENICFLQETVLRHRIYDPSRFKTRELKKLQRRFRARKAAVTRALNRSLFKTTSQAAKYRAEANKLKHKLLVRAGVRKTW